MNMLSPFPIQNAKALDPVLVQWFAQFLKPRVDKSLTAMSLTGDVSGSGGDSIDATINPKAVTLGKMADLPANTIIGNYGAAGTPEALTVAQVTALLNVFTAVLQGLVPPSGGGILSYLRADGTWAVPPVAGTAGGDLSGTYPNPSVAAILGKAIPALATGNLRYSGTTWSFDAVSYLPAANQAADSAKLNGQLPAFYQAASTAINTGNIASQAVASAGTITGTTQAVAATWSSAQTFTTGVTVGNVTVTGTGATFGGNVGVNFALMINSVAGTNKDLTWQSAGLGRWVMRVGGAEGGSNSGSDFNWMARDDTGALIDTIMAVTRAAGGAISLGRPLTTISVYKVSGVQVIGAQQTGLGATLGAATLSGTYATDLATLQTLYNKVLALETKLKVHGLVAT